MAVLALAGAAGLGITQAGDQVQPAVIVRIRGDVRVAPPGAGEFRRANERERIQPGTRIVVGPASQAVLELSDRNLVALGEKTAISLDVSLVRREVDPEQSVLFFPARRDVVQHELSIPVGTAGSVLRGLRGNSRYDLVTPVATAGARGTAFGTYVGGTQRVDWYAPLREDVSATFAVTEGSITLRGGALAEPVLVPEGHAVSVSGAGIVAPLAPMPPQASAQARQTTAPAEEVLQNQTQESIRSTDVQEGGASNPARSFGESSQY